ncbi:MAG: FKBP-type peptidyl-prolyl cis-trans isomerase [Daejeonella sp.]
MKMRTIILFFLALTLGFSACKKNNSLSPEEQLTKDENLIKEFIAKNNIPAVRHQTGVYYQIIEPGTGSAVFSANTTVNAKYTGRLLNGNVFDQTSTNPISFKLGQVIPGWQIGVPLIQKGGKIRLLIPSGYGYGDQQVRSIPANSVLDFDIELVDVQN